MTSIKIKDSYKYFCELSEEEKAYIQKHWPLYRNNLKQPWAELAHVDKAPCSRMEYLEYYLAICPYEITRRQKKVSGYEYVNGDIAEMRNEIHHGGAYKRSGGVV